MNLSEAQDKIVHAALGPILVTATAGSGKTRVLTERIRYILDERPLDGVLALTFTNKAAEEMHQRLEAVQKLQERVFVGTIHGFAQELLQKHGRHIGLMSMPHIFERDDDRLRILNEIVETEQFHDAATVLSDSFDALSSNRRSELYGWMNLISQSKRNLWSDDELRYRDENALFVRQRFDEALRFQDAIDFDDMLVLACRLLAERPALCKLLAQTYAHVCVDEAQNLNRAQYELIRLLCRGRVESILMVGDPDQSIYGFNDSSAEFMLVEFKNDFDPEMHELQENFRSSRWVLKCADRIKPKQRNFQAAKEGGGEIHCAEDDQSEARWICDKIELLLESGLHPDIEDPITLESMVVLARNRYVFLPLQEELERRNIQYFLKRPSGRQEFESETVKIFDFLLQVLLNPLDRLHCRQLLGAVKSSSLACAPDGLASKILEGTLPCDSSWLPFLQASVRGIQQAMAASNPSIAMCVIELRSLVETTSLPGGSSDESEREREFALRDLNELESHWQRYVRQQSIGARVTLDGFRNAMAMGKTQPDHFEKGLALSTVHTMIGLEYEIVFLMGLGQGTFPDYRAVRAGGKALQEEENNAFVAVTRAKRLLFATYPQTKRMPWGDMKFQAPSVYWRQLSLVQTL